MQNFIAMKKIYLVLSLVLLLAEFSMAQKRDVSFFMICKFVGPDENFKSLTVFQEPFYTFFSKKLRETFPCAYDIDDNSIRSLLGWERGKQLLGASLDGENLQNIAEAYNIDYLVVLELGTMIGNQFSVSLVCTPYRTKDKFPVARAFARCTFYENSGGEMMKKVEEVATQIIDKLKKLEICPFKGPITITNTSVFDTVKEYQYDVYCNEMDQQYHKKTEIHNYTYSEWVLSRKGNERANGDMTFKTNEKSTVVEEDGCHTCKSGRQGGRTLTEEHSLKHSGGGISHESQWNGLPQEDTRVELQFLDDGTYLVIAKGTSLPANGNEIVTKHSEGTCDTENTNDNIPRIVRIPLMAIFGPYPGKATDKVLQQKDTIETMDPISKERHTYTIDFNLKHD
jgi:hypothetical protein